MNPTSSFITHPSEQVAYFPFRSHTAPSLNCRAQLSIQHDSLPGRMHAGWEEGHKALVDIRAQL